MAYARVPKTSTDMSKLCSNPWANSTLCEMLQTSEPVKRLFNQPNIVIETVSSSVHATGVQNKNISLDKRNGIHVDAGKIERPEISIVPIKTCCDGNEDARALLPSRVDGKSEIALLPIHREKKRCGHNESCENIVCDVLVQHYEDEDGASLLLAVNIEQDEITAPVSKHCKNPKCDALSIDHNRCRRALIKLYKCDKSNTCDICGIMLKTRKSRLYHRNCVRRNVYRHNEANGAQVLKERMRERELQLMEASKTKKNDYLDPIIGHNLAMETLRNNEELIIIPKTINAQQSPVTVTSVPSAQSMQQFANIRNDFGKILSNIPIVLPQQHLLLSKKPCTDENNSVSSKRVELPQYLDNSFLNALNSSSTSHNPYVKVTESPQGSAQPSAVNDWLLTHSQIVTSTPMQSKQILAPIRVVPITNLITPPSLLHRTQGIPKFCIMTDNVLPPVIVPNLQAVQTLIPVKNNVQTDSEFTMQKKKEMLQKKSAQHSLKKKDFRCNYCFKHFSTDWYFKMHVAMHKGEKRFSCQICKESFSNRYDMKKHMLCGHKNENLVCDVCNYACTSYVVYEEHMKEHDIRRSYKCLDCQATYTNTTSLRYHRQKYHIKVKCKICEKDYLEEQLRNHMDIYHADNQKSEKLKDSESEGSKVCDNLIQVRNFVNKNTMGSITSHFVKGGLESKVNDEIIKNTANRFNHTTVTGDIPNIKIEVNPAV